MNQRKIDNPAYLYSKANISRQTFSSFIKNNNPSLNSCIKLAFTLHLTNKECKYLLKKAGFTLASSSIYSLIIRFCLENNLDLYTCNKMLINYGFEEIL